MPGAVYSLRDDSDAFEFPAPMTSWTEQPLGEGLDGLPGLNAYRLHNWEFPGGLEEDVFARMGDFHSRQQARTSTFLILSTDRYNPEGCDDGGQQTTEYSDVIIKGVKRSRGMPQWDVTVVFEVLVS